MSLQPSDITIEAGGEQVKKAVTYGSEAWTLKKYEGDRIDAADMWFYRRLLRVSWTERRTNESILSETSTTLKGQEAQTYILRTLLPPTWM